MLKTHSFQNTHEGQDGKDTPYTNTRNQARYYRKTGNLERAKALRREMQHHPSENPDDPGYRRLRYVRYADDFLLGFIGPIDGSRRNQGKNSNIPCNRAETDLISRKNADNACPYGQSTISRLRNRDYGSPTKFDRLKRRMVNGKVGMYIPEDVIPRKA